MPSRRPELRRQPKAEARRFGKALKAARLRAGLTQEDIAKKVGANQVSVSAWERATADAPSKAEERLRGILDIPRDGAEQELGGSFGAWLAGARAKKQMTIRELAEKSHVSAVQIYNIESGKTLNPRTATKTGLAAGLGSPLPADARTATEEAARIEGMGVLIDFDPYDPNDIPGEAGIYVLYDISQRPIYVGKGKSIATRIRDHDEKFWFKRPIVETASYIPVRNEKLRHQIEQVLIKFLKSNAVINKQGVSREEGSE